jgi:hypothetical protein
MTPDDVLIAIGREVCAELAMYDRLRELDALSESGKRWHEAMQDFVTRATTPDEDEEIVYGNHPLGFDVVPKEGVQWEDIQP